MVWTERPLSALLDAEADSWIEADQPVDANRLTALVALVAQAAISCGVEPIELFKADLAALRSKPYLAPYFTSVDSATG